MSLKPFPKPPVGSPDKNFPREATITVVLHFTPTYMERVKVWYQHARKELGDKFVADFDESRLMYEAVIGGGVVPDLVSITSGEKPDA